MLTFWCKKNEKRQIIPSHPFVKKNISKKRNITNQKFNVYIKELCKLANIKQPYTVEKTKGGKRVKITKPKYKWVSAHTARRSFATNFYLAHNDLQATSKFMGHSSITTTENYLKNSIDEIALKYKNSEFFS